MSFKHYLAEAATEINTKTLLFFQKWTQEVAVISPHVVPLIHSFSLANASGKRLRGALIKLGYELGAPDSPIPSDIVMMGVAYEIFQTAILAHDDVYDKSPTRRGMSSLYKALGGGQYGISQAICLGDIGYFMAVHLLMQTTLSSEIKNNVLSFFSKAILDTGMGELLDVELAEKKKQTTEQEIVTIYRFKTAYYTIITPLTLGAIAAGGNQALVGAIAAYGEQIGIAYQIQDDINDIFGNPDELKKDIGADIKEGKNTLLFFKAWEAANKQQTEVLTEYYGNTKVTDENIAEIKEIFITTGALQYAQLQANQHVEKAKQLLPKLTDDPRLGGLLYELTEFFVDKTISTP